MKRASVVLLALIALVSGCLWNWDPMVEDIVRRAKERKKYMADERWRHEVLYPYLRDRDTADGDWDPMEETDGVGYVKDQCTECHRAWHEEEPRDELSRVQDRRVPCEKDQGRSVDCGESVAGGRYPVSRSRRDVPDERIGLHEDGEG